MITTIYSILHFVVDGICAFAMFGKFVGEQDGYEFFLIYNFCAFALQMPCGALLDVLVDKSWKRSPSFCAIIGVLLTVVGVFSHPAVLGIGNALFHVGAGVDVIREDHSHGWKGQALGIFVAPGALGLFLGTQFAKSYGAKVWWSVLGLAGIVCILSILALYRRFSKDVTYPCFTKNEVFSQETDVGSYGLFKVIICCFLVVILRSYVGMAVSFPWKTTLLFSTISVLAVVLGKMAGGIFAARFGTVKTILVSLVLSAVCYLLSDFSLFGISALFFFNMTMPITLYLLVCKLKTLPGFSFGLLTFGLFLGFLPVYFGLNFQIPGKIIGMVGSILSLVLLMVCCVSKGKKRKERVLNR